MSSRRLLGRMRAAIVSCCALAAAAAWVPIAARAQLRELTVLEDFGPGLYLPSAISPDGRIVAATVWPQFGSIRYVRWIDGDAEDLFSTGGSVPASAINAMTPDGSTIVGRIQGGFDVEGFVWTAGQFARLGFLEPGGSYYMSEAKDVTADGRRIVGWSYASGRTRAVQWIDGAIAALDAPSDIAQARLVSEDGHRIAGTFRGTAGPRLAIWDDGAFRDAGDPAGGDEYADPHAVVADGSVIVGVGSFADGVRAFAWDGATFHALGQLPGGDLTSTATGVGDRGEVIVGYATQAAGAYCQGDCPDLRTPFIWTRATGMRPLRDYLRYACGYDVDRWAIGDPVLSETGRFIALPVRDPEGDTAIAVAEIGDSCNRAYAVPPNPIEPGDLLVASFGNAAVVRVDAETGAQTYVSQGGHLNHPRQLTQLPSGEILVLDGGALVGIDARSGAQRWIGGFESNPTTIAVTRTGRAFAPEWRRNPYPGKGHIVEIDLTTGATRSVAQGGGIGLAGGPLVAGIDGGLYYRGEVGEEGEEEPALLRIDPDTGVQEPIAVGDLGGSNNMTITRDGRLVLLDWNVIRIIDPATGARSTVVPDLASASLPFLFGLATSVDSIGRLLAADSYLYRVTATHLDSGRIDSLSAHLLLDSPTHAIELAAACGDGFDNDLDGRFDYPADPGCTARTDESEVHIDLSIRIRRWFSAASGTNRDRFAVDVFGSSDFDVRLLDSASIAFGPGEANPINRGAGPRIDMNGDGHPDWRFLFRAADAEVPPDADTACLRGESDAGVPAFGCAPIRAGWACGLGFEVAFGLLPFLWLRARRRLGR